MGAGRVQSWRDFLGSFAHAAAGIGFALRSERNMRVHLLVAGLVLIAGLWLQIDLTGFRWLVLAMALVMIAELLNTGIEQACNAITREKRPEIRAAKDVAAGAVLIASIAAALIGGSVLGPPLWQNLAPMLFETWAPL
ncbi:diacylglycerol kinase [Altererythrobacter xixiisoli]|uniref:Diacylglycerol kinase n=2 Tax=Croceibacterium xixiisoli TaxID=1476466 RepID=A0A6I4TTV8_9SPHN|nr:diacylglycerol kinase [Croceibacterium xixiisoli]